MAGTAATGVHDWNQQHSLSSGLLSTLELCSAGKFAVPYSRSFHKITQCGDIRLTVGPHQTGTSGIHIGQVLGVKHPEVPWGLENRVTFWETLLWQNFQHSQVSEAAAAQSRGRCCDLLLVLERISLPSKDCSCKRWEKAELTAVLSCLPQQALQLCVMGHKRRTTVLSPLFHLKKAVAPLCPLLHTAAALMEVADGRAFPK